MPRRRSGVTAGRLRKVGAEIGVDASDVLAKVAALLKKIGGSQSGRQAVGQEFKRRVMIPSALIGKREIQDLAPVGKEPESGRIKKAVFVDYGDPKKPNVVLGMNYKIAPHAHWLEYGTVKMRPQSYFRTGITSSRSAMAATMLSNAKEFITEDK